jgi:hypothetical protein
MKPLFLTEAQRTAMYFPITNNYGTALYTYDPVIAVTAGTIERAAASDTFCGTILGLYRSTTASQLRTEKLLPVQYMAASPGASYTYFALVAVDPDIFCIMQEDGDTSSLQIGDNFGNVDFIFTHAGNTTTGISGAEIDSNTADNTATRPLKLIYPAVNFYDVDAGAYMAVSSAGAAGNFGKWIVKPNYHQFGQGNLSLGLA